jgi:hypothetical protein
MRARISVCAVLFAFSLLVVSAVVQGADYPKESVSVKLEGAKMAPVAFSHGTHVEKGKIECVKCHHKDADKPQACEKCHGKEAKDKSPSGKDAFHATCQNCHKDAAAKGAKAPTKCNECHKK